jgi:hypothetical protein
MHLGNRIFAKRLNIHTRSSLLSRSNGSVILLQTKHPFKLTFKNFFFLDILETQNIMQLCLKQLEAVNIEIETLTSPETQNNSKGFIRKVS